MVLLLWLVVACGVKGEVADEFSGGRINDADVEVVDEHDDVGSGVGSPYADVVADNGRGVTVADRERVFEHFEQVTKGDARREYGIGLGLPIARRLARAMGGDVWYEERFPTGSRFCFTLRTAGHMIAPSVVKRCCLVRYPPTFRS